MAIYLKNFKKCFCFKLFLSNKQNIQGFRQFVIRRYIEATVVGKDRRRVYWTDSNAIRQTSSFGRAFLVKKGSLNLGIK